MKIERFNEIVKEETDRIEGILVKKQAEYNLDEDRLSHFKHAAAMSNWPIEKVVYGYMLKHLMSVTDMVNSGEKFSKALWQEKMTDIHNYLILLLAVLEDEGKFSEGQKCEMPKKGCGERKEGKPFIEEIKGVISNFCGADCLLEDTADGNYGASADSASKAADSMLDEILSGWLKEGLAGSSKAPKHSENGEKAL